MDTSQLECMIDCDVILKDSVIGVFAADRLPRGLPRGAFGFIANTDIHTKPGKHWCAFYSDNGRDVDFFDSYGRGPNQNSPRFGRWVERNSTNVRINHVQIQSDSSALCGLYCILFLHQRLLGYTYQEFMNIFSASDFNANDSFIAETMFNAYSECIRNELVYNQTCGCLVTC